MFVGEELMVVPPDEGFVVKDHFCPGIVSCGVSIAHLSDHPEMQSSLFSRTERVEGGCIRLHHLRGEDSTRDADIVTRLTPLHIVTFCELHTAMRMMHQTDRLDMMLLCYVSSEVRRGERREWWVTATYVRSCVGWYVCADYLSLNLYRGWGSRFVLSH